jgi:hypothetical protein
MNIGSGCYLYCDIVERLRARHNLQGTAREIQLLRMAVQDAYDDLANHYDWKWYNRRLIITTSPTVTATVDFDLTGGTAERLFTLASGTLPSWLRYGFVSYNNQAYYVDRVLNSTTFTVKDGSSPNSDLNDVSVVFVRESYPLPYTIRTINEVWSTTAPRKLSPSNLRELTGYSRITGRYGTALQYNMQRSNVDFGVTDFTLLPAQENAETFEINCVVYPKALRVYEEKGVDGAATGTSVFTSAGAKFSSNMVGSILRLSPDGNLPKSNYHFEESRSEWESQWMIVKVNSTTEIEVNGTLGTFTNRGYVVSDIVDIMPEVHLNLLEVDSSVRFNSMAMMPKDNKMMYEADKRQTLKDAVMADGNINWTLNHTIDGWPDVFFNINPYAAVRFS